MKNWGYFHKNIGFLAILAIFRPFFSRAGCSINRAFTYFMLYWINFWDGMIYVKMEGQVMADMLALMDRFVGYVDRRL